jgi:hypothetical protein
MGQTGELHVAPTGAALGILVAVVVGFPSGRQWAASGGFERWIDLLRHKRRAGVTKIALLSFAILMAGCTSEAERLVQQYEMNDSICKKSHVYGTGSYWNCRAARDQMVVLRNNTLRRALIHCCRAQGTQGAQLGDEFQPLCVAGICTAV